jgi:hypothetical protein
MNSLAVLIPILGICCGIIAILGGTYIKARKMKLDMLREQNLSGATSSETQNEIQRLKDRVAVLERLLTDGDRRLASDIERLRRPEERI